MEGQSKGSRGLEAYCKGGQGPPRAAAPSKKKKSHPPVLLIITIFRRRWVWRIARMILKEVIVSESIQRKFYLCATLSNANLTYLARHRTRALGRENPATNSMRHSLVTKTGIYLNCKCTTTSVFTTRSGQPMFITKINWTNFFREKISVLVVRTT